MSNFETSLTKYVRFHIVIVGNTCYRFIYNAAFEEGKMQFGFSNIICFGIGRDNDETNIILKPQSRHEKADLFIVHLNNTAVKTA